MLRETADQLHRALLGAFPPDKDYPQERFRREPMPEAIQHFLERTLESRLVKLGEIAPSPWYDVNAPVVRATREAWRAALFSTALVPAPAWSKTLEHAVRLVLAYLVRPAQTLTAFVFGSEDRHVETGAVLQRVDYFSEYSYLRAGVREYVSKEHLGHVNRTPFLNLITRLDRAYTAGFGADDWMRHLQTLFDLMRLVPDGSGRAGVPVDVLQTFFEHKATTEITQRLQEEGKRDPGRVMDEAELYGLMTSQRRRVTSRPEAEKKPAPSAERGEEQGEGRRGRSSGPTLSELTLSRAEEVTAPLWMRFRKDESPEEPGVEEAPSEEDVIGGILDGELADAPEPADDDPAIVDDPGAALEGIDLGPEGGAAPPAPMASSTSSLADERQREGVSGKRSSGDEPPGSPRTVRDTVGGPASPRKLADVVADALRGVPDTAQEGGGQGRSGTGDDLASVPLWMRFRKDSEPSPGEAVDGAEPRGDASAEPTRKGGMPKDRERGTGRDSAATAPEPDVERPRPSAGPAEVASLPLERLEREVFGPTDPARREWFVQHLFGDSDDEYSEVLRDIAGCESWPEASRVIARAVFRKHNVNIYSEPAVAFTDAIESYFRRL